MIYYIKNNNQIGTSKELPLDSKEITKQEYLELIQHSVKGDYFELRDNQIIVFENKQYPAIDNDGVYQGLRTPDNKNNLKLVKKPKPENFYKAKLENEDWVESATTEEIDKIEKDKLEKIRTEYLNNLKELNKNAIEDGVEFEGDNYELKSHDQTNIMGAFLNSQVDPNIIIKPSFKDKEGNKIVKTLNATQVQQLYILTTTHIGKCLETYNDTESEIKNAIDEDAMINAINGYETAIFGVAEGAI